MGAPNNQRDRLSQLEIGLTSLTTQLGEFVKDSRDYRERAEREQAAIWQTLKEQNAHFTAALEKLAGKGALSWQVVAMTIGLILSMVCTAAGLGHAFMESRMRQVEVHLDYQKEEILRNRDRLDGHDQRLQAK